MGTAVFLVIHIIALVSFPLALFVTIPLHLIYAAASGNSKPDTYNHGKCPACQELVHIDASICPHCRSKLVPYFERRRLDKKERAAARAGMRWWQW
jgi:predicted amidophosphoribosyltransferase